mmetsp:Transcript_263/g.300  ORF Transcript_263/g.300 Transcript_263/m.300 type:complete len:403 (+) Transcript_263:362-1570(+)
MKKIVKQSAELLLPPAYIQTKKSRSNSTSRNKKLLKKKPANDEEKNYIRMMTINNENNWVDCCTTSQLEVSFEGERRYKSMNSLFQDEGDYDSDDAIMGDDILATKSQDFSVLGTSYDMNNDYHHKSSHVLSPSLMDALRSHLPSSIKESNFWLKYSMIRDGANIRTLLQKVKSSKRTLLAIETMEGDIIGSFTSAPWCKTIESRGYFGSGEAFVWRTDNKEHSSSSCATTHTTSSAKEKEDDDEEQKSIVEVFHWSGKNCNIQALVNEKQQLMIGGGVTDDDNYLSLLSSMSGDIYSSRSGNEDEDSDHDDNGDGGCSIIINADMLNGSSSECATFSSPPLIVSKPTSSTMSTTSTINTTATNEFQIVNLEVWSFTPFDTVDEAEKLECGVKFQVDHRCDY